MIQVGFIPRGLSAAPPLCLLEQSHLLQRYCGSTESMQIQSRGGSDPGAARTSRVGLRRAGRSRPPSVKTNSGPIGVPDSVHACT